VKGERTDLLAARVLGVFARELAAARLDVGVEEDARDEPDRREQRGEDERDSAKGKSRAQ
jgi:hypothetical protein